jgi:hypothetical protein
MDQQILATSYAEAIKIVRTVKFQSIEFAPVNDKMWRVISYLEKQAKAELTCLRA